MATVHPDAVGGVPADKTTREGAECQTLEGANPIPMWAGLLNAHNTPDKTQLSASCLAT